MTYNIVLLTDLAKSLAVVNTIYALELAKVLRKMADILIVVLAHESARFLWNIVHLS